MESCKEDGASCGFHCTGYEGAGIWKKIHSIPKEIDCEECSYHAKFELEGLHDHVNAGLGKPIYNKEQYRKWVDEVNCACKRSGVC